MPIFVGDFANGELDPTGAGRTVRTATTNIDQDPAGFVATLKADPNASGYFFGADGKGTNPALAQAAAGFFAAKLGAGKGQADPKVTQAAMTLATVFPESGPFVTAYSMLPPNVRSQVDPYIGKGIDLGKQFAQGLFDPFGGISGSGAGPLDFFSNPSLSSFGSLLGALSPWGLFSGLLNLIGFGPDWGDVEPQIRQVVQGLMDKGSVPLRIDKVGLPSLPDVGDLIDAFSDQDTSKILGWLKNVQINATVTANLLPSEINTLVGFITQVPGSFDFSKASAAFQNAGASAGSKIWLDLSKSPPVAYDPAS